MSLWREMMLNNDWGFNNYRVMDPWVHIENAIYDPDWSVARALLRSGTSYEEYMKRLEEERRKQDEQIREAFNRKLDVYNEAVKRQETKVDKAVEDFKSAEADITAHNFDIEAVVEAHKNGFIHDKVKALGGRNVAEGTPRKSDADMVLSVAYTLIDKWNDYEKIAIAYQKAKRALDKESLRMEQFQSGREDILTSLSKIEPGEAPSDVE